jgi:hypothetical protein
MGGQSLQQIEAASKSSWLSRPTTPFCAENVVKNVNARDKRGHGIVSDPI